MSFRSSPAELDPELERLLDSLEQAGGEGPAELRKEIRARVSTLIRQHHDAAPRVEAEADVFYRALINAIDVGFCVIEVIFDPSGKAVDYRFLETNPAFDKQTGLVACVGKRIRELAPMQDENWFEIYGKVVLTGEPIRFENHSRPLQRWFDVYALRVGAPEQRRVAVLFSDITERKRVQEALRQSQTKLAAALDSMSDALFISDREGRYTDFNDAFATFHRFASKEECARTLAAHPEVIEAATMAGRPVPVDRWGVPRPPSAEQAMNAEYRLHRRDTGESWVGSYSFGPLRDEQGGIIGSVMTARDITEVSRAEQALRESEERFRAVADNIPQLAWMTGPKGEILWFNRRWYEYTGYSLPEMQRLGWGAVHHPEHPHSVVERWNRTLESGVPWEDTFQLRARDGTYRWFLSRAFPIRDAQGGISRWFGTNTDITQLRETEEALKKAHEELQRHAQVLESTVAERTARLRETVEELEAFSYTVTHDMRGPLRAMQGFAQIVETEYGPQLGAEGGMYMKRIGAAAARLDQLIRDVLAYSRVVRHEVRLHPVDPARLIQQLMEENPALQPPRAEITVERPLDRVLGNEAFLMQVVSNLIYNAVKFVAPGTQPRIRIWTETADTRVKLFVRDNGVGIPLDARQKIFGMFQRFHVGQPYEGTGIGLAIVRKAVERMGGSVAVDSEPGRGSTFIVALQQV